MKRKEIVTTNTGFGASNPSVSVWPFVLCLLQTHVVIPSLKLGLMAVYQSSVDSNWSRHLSPSLNWQCSWLLTAYLRLRSIIHFFYSEQLLSIIPEQLSWVALRICSFVSNCQHKALQFKDRAVEIDLLGIGLFTWPQPWLKQPQSHIEDTCWVRGKVKPNLHLEPLRETFLD